MAGGMNKRGGGVPMSERVALGRQPDPPVDAGPAECPARHCWVLDPADRSGRRRPGLLLEWRHAGTGGWEGRVVYAVQLRAGLWAALEEWLPSVLLEAGPDHPS